jgi:hypothetical protein
MEDSLSNSFYYFFSAVPQVLGAVLGLFGVFVLFKIQSLKSQLLGIAQLAYNIGEDLNFQVNEKTQNGIKIEKVIGRAIIKETIEKSDIKRLSEILNSIVDPFYITYIDNYNRSYKILKLLSTATVGASVYTAGVIFAALLILPLGHFFLQHNTLLYILFAISLLAVGFSLILFVKILMKSIDDLR